MVMFNLFDILQAQGGGMQSLGQQFGLSPDQSRRAMEALLPALTIGLQRNAANDPAGFGRLFGLAGADQHAGARRAAQPDMLLGQLFGSPALSQAVLQQAAATSGIGQQALRQMLPIMAGMIVAGIVHVMLNQPAAASLAREPEPPPPAFPGADLWNDWMNTFLSSAYTAAGGTESPSAQRLDKAPVDRAHSGYRSKDASEPRVPEPAPKPAEPEPATKAGDESDAPLEVFQQMFQTGVQVQEQNVRAMQDIFDSFWSEPAGKGSKVSGAASAGSPNAGNARAKPAGRKPPSAKPT